MTRVSLSAAAEKRYPGLRFAVVRGGVVDDGFAQRIERSTADFPTRIAERGPRITEGIHCFDAFFRAEGHACPLPGQFASARKKGLPPVPPLVRALLYAELTTGVLMGVQDGRAIDGELLLDLAEAGESYPGMRSTVTCRENEIVVRDGSGIVASFFQGPDKKTQISAGTTEPVCYVFAAPGLDDRLFTAAVDAVRSLLPAGAEATICGRSAT